MTTGHKEMFALLPESDKVAIIHDWLHRIAVDPAFERTRPLIAQAIAPALDAIVNEIQEVKAASQKEVDGLKAALAKLEAAKAGDGPAKRAFPAAVSAQLKGYELLRWRQAFAPDRPAAAALAANTVQIRGANKGVTNK